MELKIASEQEYLEHNPNGDYASYVESVITQHEEDMEKYQEWVENLSDEERWEHNNKQPPAVGKRLKEARKKFGVTQDKVAELLEISKQSISNYETGSTYPPDKILDKLCKLYNVEPHIIKGTEPIQQYAVHDEILARLQYIKTVDYNNYNIQYSNPFEPVLSEEDWLRELISDGTRNLNLEQLRQLKDMILTWSLLNVGTNFK